MDRINLYILDTAERVKECFASLDFSGFDQYFDYLHSKGVRVLLILLLIFVLSFIINILLSKSFLGKGYRIFVAPGVILHELSHALLCVLTGAKITKVSLFDKEGGSVTHEKPKLPVLGQILISLAPFVFGAVAIYFLSSMVGLRTNSFDWSDFHYHQFLGFLKATAGSMDLTSYKNWAIIYLVLAVAVTMTPSKEDFKNMFLSLLVVGLAIFAVLRFTPFRLGESMILYDKVMVLLSTVALLLILSLLLSIIIFAVSNFFKRK